jgi:galactoside O-acetyltransferase
MAFLNLRELYLLGLKKFGDNVLISDKCSIINAENISLGSNVRIDDFTILSAGTEITIGSYVHIGCYSSLIGKGKIILEDFVTISGRVSIYSSTDDYIGIGMTGPMIPDEYRNVTNKDVIIKKFAIIGSGSVILPGALLNEGCSIGALSLVKIECDEFTLYTGNPLKKRGLKFKEFLKFEKYLPL